MTGRRPLSLSRRELLGAGVAGTAALGLGVSFTPRARAAGAVPDLRRWVLDHATAGFTLRDWDEVQRLGYDAWLERQLDWQNLPDPAMDDLLAREFPSLTMDYGRLYHEYTIKGLDYIPMAELKSAAILRALYSRRQLYERMVEFWNDHFSIDHNSSFALQTVFDREVIRKHALGNFRDMLEASAHAGAMLIYLNNDTNVVGNAQENYARELMELHTLGVNGPYTEQDVGEVARALTGWSPYNSQLYYGEFTFRKYDHDYDAKHILGRDFPAGRGKGEGDRVLRILGRHRATSEYLAFKMCRWLLHYEPSDELVQKVAKAYRQTDGDIRSMLRVIFDPNNVGAERGPSQWKLKRPFQFLTSALRATYVDVGGWSLYLRRGEELYYHLAAMGHSPFDNPTPDGYLDDPAAWASVLPRWKFAQQYFDDQLLTAKVSVPELEEKVGPFERATAADQIQTLLGDALSSEDLAQVDAFIQRSRPFHEPRLREALALAVSSPSFQTY